MARIPNLASVGQHMLAEQTRASEEATRTMAHGKPITSTHTVLVDSTPFQTTFPLIQICNNYRLFYGTEEFQWILKLGVCLRTKIELEERIGLEAASQFVRSDNRRAKRKRLNK
jgi:hypothetical protein